MLLRFWFPFSSKCSSFFFDFFYNVCFDFHFLLKVCFGLDFDLLLAWIFAYVLAFDYLLTCVWFMFSDFSLHFVFDFIFRIWIYIPCFLISGPLYNCIWFLYLIPAFVFDFWFTLYFISDFNPGLIKTWEGISNIQVFYTPVSNLCIRFQLIKLNHV